MSFVAHKAIWNGRRSVHVTLVVMVVVSIVERTVLLLLLLLLMAVRLAWYAVNETSGWGQDLLLLLLL